MVEIDEVIRWINPETDKVFNWIVLNLEIVVGLVGLIVGTVVLWLSANLLRFRNPSFWTSLSCMALAIGVWVVVVRVHVLPRMSFWATVGAGFGIVAVVGMISIAWLFREPPWKTSVAIGLVLVSEALWLAVCLAILGDLLIRIVRNPPL